MNVSAGTVYAKVIGGKKQPKRTVWFLDYYVDGQRRRKACRASSKTEAWAMLKAETTDLDRKEKRLPSNEVYRLRDLVDEYIEFKKGQGRRSTDRMRISLDHLLRHLGDLYIHRIDSDRLEAYRKDRQKEGVGMKTVNREMATLKNFYNVMARKMKKFSGPNPVLDIDFYPEPARLHRILSQEEFHRLLEATEPRFRPIIRVAVMTGLRKNDILGLKWKNIDFERGELQAFVSKTQKWQTLPLAGDVSADLAGIVRDGEYVFQNPATKTRFKDVQFWFTAARTKANLPGLTFHDLRANAATTMRTAGVPIAIVRDLLGHSSEKMTEIYTNPTLEHLHQAVRAAEDFFRERTPGGHQDSVTDAIKNN